MGVDGGGLHLESGRESFVICCTVPSCLLNTSCCLTQQHCTAVACAEVVALRQFQMCEGQQVQPVCCPLFDTGRRLCAVQFLEGLSLT
jgi:hypothetical protein